MAISTLPKKARIVQPSEDLLHDSDQSSIIMEAPLDPSPEPHQHTNPSMQMEEGQEPISSDCPAPSMPSDGMTRPH